MDGWIILDKDSGIFSRTAGARISRIFGTKKFGHIGTLDPMASGVLPIAIGGATKMIPFIEEFSPATKEYLFSLQFGFETDTLDITGTEIARDNFIPPQDAVIASLDKFIGDTAQVPPIYSAVHIDGVRAYELARRNINVDVKSRMVHIDKLEYIGRCGDSWQFKMRCSRGTYVRSVARDLAKSVSAMATVDMIRRTQSGPFCIGNTVKLDFLENLFNNGMDVGQYLCPIDSGLGDISVLNLIDDKSVVLFQNGGFVSVPLDNDTVRVYNRNNLIGIGRIENGVLKPKRII